MLRVFRALTRDQIPDANKSGNRYHCDRQGKPCLRERFVCSHMIQRAICAPG